jgi:hypothetical protein
VHELGACGLGGGHVLCRFLSGGARGYLLALAATTSGCFVPTLCSAYPFLVRLHCLQELEASVELARVRSQSGKLAKLQDWDWDGRLDLIMPSLRWVTCAVAAAALLCMGFISGSTNVPTHPPPPAFFSPAALQTK